MLSIVTLNSPLQKALQDTVLGRVAKRSSGYRNTGNMLMIMGEVSRGDYALPVSEHVALFVMHDLYRRVSRI